MIVICLTPDTYVIVAFKPCIKLVDTIPEYGASGSHGHINKVVKMFYLEGLKVMIIESEYEIDMKAEEVTLIEKSANL